MVDYRRVRVSPTMRIPNSADRGMNDAAPHGEIQMRTPIETVTIFLTRFSEGKEGLYDSVRRWFTPDTVWENVGLAVTTGPAEAIGLAAQFEQQMGVASVAVELLAIAATGRSVLTERIDHLLAADGTEVWGPRVMGIFEIENDKIVAWRDYFDTAGTHARAQKWARRQSDFTSASI
jgi:limonene-1,2-epoxide hydrolase